MEWVTNRAYSFNSIVRALDNKRNCVADNAHYPLLEARPTDKVLIVGGGNSAIEHQEAIKEYLKAHPSVAVVFATCRHAASYLDIDNDKYYCLVGNEAKRMKRNIKASEFNGKCILAPFPRKMGTEVPDFAEDSTFELKDIVFTQDYLDSCTAIALQIALDLEVGNIVA
jgi:4-hydroxy 2-oxovalerate aldolase